MAQPAKAAATKRTKPAAKVKASKAKASPNNLKQKKNKLSTEGVKDDERKRLQAELEVARDSAAAQDAAAHALEVELAALRMRHIQDANASSDVLASQQREQARLAAAARQLEQALEASKREAAQLQRALQDELDAVAEQAEADAEIAGQPSSELQRALSHQRRQEERIAAQQRETERLRARLQRAEDGLATSNAAMAALQVKAASRSELRFVQGQPWLLHVGRERLTGALPSAAQPGSLLVAAGRRLVLEVPASGAAGQAGEQQPSVPHSLHTLDLSTGVWTGTEADQHGGIARAGSVSIAGRAVCSVGSKLLGVGGTCPDGSLLPATDATQQLLPDLPHWAPAPTPAETAALPEPRHCAALAYCPITNAAFLYGGRTHGGRLLDDLWRYDMALARWTRLDSVATARQLPAGERARTPCVPERPPPCCGAALAVSEAGDRVWLMGGTLGDGRFSSELHWFDVCLRYWAAAEPLQSSSIVAPRSQHVMACIGRYVVVVGGLMRSANGAVTRRRDTCLWDTASCTWEVLDETAFEPQMAAGSSQPGAVISMAAGRHFGRRAALSHGDSCTNNQRGLGPCPAPATAFLGAGSAAFLGTKLLLLKPADDSGLVSELWTVDMGCPPERIEELRAAKHAASAVVRTLSLTCHSITATSVRLSWRAPTAGADKLMSYKLMMTNAEGLAREAYEGPETSCNMTGLPYNSQLVFCVKALYDDKRFLWSEPLMVTTAAKGGLRARQKTAGEVAGGWPGDVCS